MFKVLDLFAGCGGLSLGLSQAGFTVDTAIEKDQWACDTYRCNHPDTEVVQANIKELSNDFFIENFRGKIDLIAGGPPCQGFSISGKRQYGEVKEQNNLVQDFIRVVECVQPKAVLIENVSGFKTGEIKPGDPVMSYILESLKSLNYSVSARTLQAGEYGVPSLRTRIFIIAFKNISIVDPFPEKTHYIKQTHKSFDLLDSILKPAVTVQEAINDLPILNASEGSNEFIPYTNAVESDYQFEIRKNSIGVANHVAMKHTPRLVERFKKLQQGNGSYNLGRTDNSQDEIVTTYKSNNQRLNLDKPALCITANFQSTYVHPTQPRSLTAREAARLMTFPDSYFFCGKRTQMSSAFLKKHGREHEDFLSQYNQIGNAVPPLLAKAIGTRILEILNKEYLNDH